MSPRNRASARHAGARFERTVADYLHAHASEFIDRRVSTGTRDTGDIGGVRTPHGHRFTVEAKDYAGRYNLLGPWLIETEAERMADCALAGAVVIKRRGTQDPGAQLVVMTLRDLVALLTGARP
jgi:hypothetical protein